MPLKQILFFIACLFFHSACQYKGPNIPGPGGKITDKELHEMNQMYGFVGGKDWDLDHGDIESLTSNGTKYFVIRLTDSSSIQACTKDAKPSYTDTRIYITVPAKTGTTYIGGASTKIASFQFYRDNQSYIYDVQQGTVEITKVTDQLVQGTFTAEGYANHVSGKFAATRCGP